MSAIKEITSVQNALVKKMILLKEKSRERKKTRLFVIEGQRELDLALKGGYVIDTLCVCPEITEIDFAQADLKIKTIHISKEVFKKVAHRDTTEGVLALVESKEHSLQSSFKLKENPLILVAEAPEKPGNLGALLRTADAANLDAVLIANPKTDLYNPNIIRSSVGCIFTNKIVTGSSKELINFLNNQKIKIFCAALTASKNYVEADFTGGSAIVVGTEATGLTDEWLNNSFQNVIIPMQGEIDSMNVSVSAAILIFEAKRQRGF